tara:strand:+ start:3328 stop:4599 length:1272 start_codon:yes stop_codon:yes gene_type:complete
MRKLFFIKPNISNLNICLPVGSFLILLSFLDIFLNTFYNLNLSFFIIGPVNKVLPLLLGMIGFYLIRIEYSGKKYLDIFNKKINLNNFNALCTLIISFSIIKIMPLFLSWFIIDANFAGDNKSACTGSGACWVYIKVWFERFIYGMYPTSEIWRINISFILIIAFGLFGLFSNEKIKRYLLLYYAVVYPILAFIIIYFLVSGGVFNLEWVQTNAWGGLSLTFIVAFFALIFCFPIGLFLALGRRSNLIAVRYISIGFIEFWRGVPLITVLFMSAVIFPLFLPSGVYIDTLVRAIFAIALFEAAYIAEVIRGGLQALPKGQYEAARSLGMGYWKSNYLIILPQALKIVIPGIANTFLALVKDTPLIFVVGLLEIVGMTNLAKTNPKWLGLAMEGYIFAGLIFFLICYVMSKYSQNLEKKLSTGR